jgi:hypothetical protein
MKEIMISAGYDEAGITNQEPAPAEKANLLVQAGLF